MMHITNEHCLI